MGVTCFSYMHHELWPIYSETYNFIWNLEAYR